jgi:hypothetical protein
MISGIFELRVYVIIELENVYLCVLPPGYSSLGIAMGY